MVRWEAESEASVRSFKQHCERIGSELWQKSFQNCRASLVTNLLEEHSVKDVCTWLGNSEATKNHPWAAKNRMLGACTICMAMFGSGVRICMEITQVVS